MPSPFEARAARGHLRVTDHVNQFVGWAERSEAHVLIDDGDDKRGHGALP